MLVKTRAIVLSAIKYQEKSLIVKCFTQNHGVKTYFVANAFSTKKNHQKAGYFQPLTILEIEATHKNKGTLEYFKEIKLGYVYQTAHTVWVKSTVVMFLSEVLHCSLKEEEHNENLFSFLETALIWFDTHTAIANFHLVLLFQLTKFLGFYPSVSSGSYFEMTEGVFYDFPSATSLNEDETRLFKKLFDLKINHLQNTFSQKERQQLIKILLDFYTIHISGFKKPKSVEVLAEVFK